MAATAAQVQSVLNNPNFFQKFYLRRHARKILNDSDMEGRLLNPLVTESLAMGKGATEADAQAMLDGDFSAAAKKVSAALAANHGFQAGDVGSSPFIDMLMQLFQQLMPLLLSCLKPIVP